ncbi:claudin domain-containing protein 1 isoform X1, partial [Astyanax mexicanus]
SALAAVYLSVAVGTQHWYQYSSPPVYGEPNASELRSLYEEFTSGEFDEKTYSDSLFRLNGTLGLWWRCLQVPPDRNWNQESEDGDSDGVCELHSVSAVHTKVQGARQPQQWRGPDSHLSVEESVPPASGLSGVGGVGGVGGFLCLYLPESQPHPRHWITPPTRRDVFSGDGLLFPGWDGSPPPRLHVAGSGGWFSGLVAVSGADLLASADDGGGSAGLGGKKPQQELLPHDGVPRGLDQNLHPVLHHHSSTNNQAIYRSVYLLY